MTKFEPTLEMLAAISEAIGFFRAIPSGDESVGVTTRTQLGHLKNVISESLAQRIESEGPPQKIYAGTPVVIYGPPGSGKTSNAELLREFYGKEEVVDEWNPYQELHPNKLFLTTSKEVYEYCHKHGELPAIVNHVTAVLKHIEEPS